MKIYIMSCWAWATGRSLRRLARDVIRESKKEGGVLVMSVGHQHATTNLVGHLVPFFVTLAVPAVAYTLFFVFNDANACRPTLNSDALLAAVPSLSDLWDSDAAFI